jgi:putative DNA primase/helicase
MRLHPPEVVRVAVEDYREEEDTIGEFLVTECLKGEGKVVTRAELFHAYTLWSESRGVRHGFGMKSVADRVRRESGVEGASRRIKKKVRKVWLGIEIADPASFPL